MPIEKSLVLIKPDGVKRKLIAPVLSMLDIPGIRIKGIKSFHAAPEDLVKLHYAKHRGEYYYPWLCKQLIGHPVVAVCYFGTDAVSKIREITGPKEPQNAPDDTIRGRFRDDSTENSIPEGRAVRNVVHASSDPEEALREIKIWFSLVELF